MAIQIGDKVMNTRTYITGTVTKIVNGMYVVTNDEDGYPISYVDYAENLMPDPWWVQR